MFWSDQSIYEEGKASYNTNTNWSKWAFILALSVMMKLNHANKPYSPTAQSLHGIVRNQERVTQAYETSVSKKRLLTKQTTLHFVVGNEQRFPLLLGTNNTWRIFMVLSETKSALVIKISRRYCLFTDWHSDLFSICFFGWLDFFVSDDITKISGNTTQVSGDMTSGEMTLGGLDRLPPKEWWTSSRVENQRIDTEQLRAAYTLYQHTYARYAALYQFFSRKGSFSCIFMQSLDLMILF